MSGLVATMFMTVSDCSQDGEHHLGGFFWERFREEVRRPHAGLHRAEEAIEAGFKSPSHASPAKLTTPNKRRRSRRSKTKSGR
jgi:hypothetical protein